MGDSTSPHRSRLWSDTDLPDEIEDELFGSLTSREAMHSYHPSSSDRDSQDSAESSRLSLPPRPPSQDFPFPPTPEARASSETNTILAEMIASTPRPCFDSQALASMAATKASKLVRDNPTLRGDDLLRAIRKAEEDVVLENNFLKERQRVASQTMHHSVYGLSLFSGPLSKKSGGRRASMEVTLGKWKTRHFVLKQSCLVYYLTDDADEPRDALMFDKSLEVKASKSDPHNFQLITSTRALNLRAESEEDASNWIAAITSQFNLSAFSKSHVHSSFTPMRDGSTCSAIVDAEDYFKAVAYALSLAASEIFIAGWWVNIDLPLLRDPEKPPTTLRDLLLDAACNRNVKIYVLLYKEQAIAMPNNSQYAEEIFNTLHPNVFALRHPHPLDVDATLWSHHEKLVVVDRRIAFVGGMDLAPGRFDNSSHQCAPKDRATFFPGQDYWNSRAGDFKPSLLNTSTWTSDAFNVEINPRMGWHDCATMISGGFLVGDVCRHFVQRWLHHRADVIKGNKHVPIVLPATEGVVHAGAGPNLSVEGIVRNAGLSFHNSTRVVGQCLRSAGRWSTGLKTERSIYNCMMRLISNARRFIYIENQYFCLGFREVGEEEVEEDEEDPLPPSPSTEDADSRAANRARKRLIKNGIGTALFRRISEAIGKGENFKVVVVYPHLSWEHNPVQSTILQLQNESIRTLMSKLKEAHPQVEDWGQYISLNNLRAWGRMGHRGVKMEEIYVHDKLLIVDDRTTLIGSANINDRSLLGMRDSEVALLFHDVETVETSWAGETVKVGGFSNSLRCRLWREHLGEEGSGVEDPLGMGFDMWRHRARANRRLFEASFPYMYRNEYKKMKQVPGMNVGAAKWESNPSSDDETGLEGIRGFVVEAAVYFLEDQNLLPKVGTKAYLMPLHMFV
ncbi:hypothetical protein TrRE_jg4121 [Triparma retinervis]|uniref:phospholipase D n=1 Tax=Triparma retinervis TaxID=2557542 RepID=A0A9W7EC03_9STRA|nr:hypothetical protein TrRE_jg4121 [Triparma retinervis]